MSATPRSFEQAMTELDAVVGKIESGELALDEMVEAYRRGAELVKFCREKLAAARQDIKVMEKDILKPFSPPDKSDHGE